jgi:cytochrome P450
MHFKPPEPQSNPGAKRVRRIEELPGPRGVPWLGNALQIDPSKAHRQFEQWAADYGSPYRLKVGPKRIVVWTDHHVANQLLRDRPKAFRRGGRISQVLEEMRIGGLFAAEGSAWLSQRKFVMQALNVTHFPEFYPTLRTIALRLHARLTRLSEEGRVVDMLHELTGFTVDAVCALAFGADPNTLDQGPDRIQRQLQRIFPMFMKRLLAPFPYWRWFRLPQDRALDAALDEVHAYVQTLIDAARTQMQRMPGQPPANLLQSMLAAGTDADAAAIAANVLTLLLAGEDTTAHSLAWTIPYLCGDSALQDELAAQARQAMGGDPVCSDYRLLQQLDLFEAVVTEAQRLKPVVGMLSFTPTSATVVDDVALPPDCIVYAVSRPAMTDASNFRDPQRFDPHRWLERRDGAAHEPRAFLQFGAGPRVCPGRHLAAVQMRLVLTTILNSFRMELACAPESIEEINAFTVMPSRMPVRLRPRNK